MSLINEDKLPEVMANIAIGTHKILNEARPKMNQKAIEKLIKDIYHAIPIAYEAAVTGDQEACDKTIGLLDNLPTKEEALAELQPCKTYSGTAEITHPLDCACKECLDNAKALKNVISKQAACKTCKDNKKICEGCKKPKSEIPKATIFGDEHWTFSENGARPLGDLCGDIIPCPDCQKAEPEPQQPETTEFPLFSFPPFIPDNLKGAHVLLKRAYERIKHLTTKNKRQKELLARHRICINCGKQLSVAEAEGTHTCYNEAELEPNNEKE